MNQIVYYKFLSIILFFSFLSPLEAKLLKPSENGEEKEILLVKSKRRLYYPVKKEGLVFNLEGPLRLEFISRLPVLKNKKNSYTFSYRILIDEEDTVNVKHKYKVQKSIESVQHPKHNYTYSGNYFINLKKGQHKIQIISDQKQKYPTLIRLVTKEFENLGNKRKILSPMIHKNAVSLLTGDKKVDYYECSSAIPLQIEVNGKKTLKIMSRLEFSQSMGQEESYRIRVREGLKVVGTYYFNTERSSASQILKKPTLVPGKWRSCEIPVKKGKHSYSIEVADKGKVVLARFILY